VFPCRARAMFAAYRLAGRIACAMEGLERGGRRNTPRSLSAAAMARSDVTPAACSSEEASGHARTRQRFVRRNGAMPSPTGRSSFTTRPFGAGQVRASIASGVAKYSANPLPRSFPTPAWISRPLKAPARAGGNTARPRRNPAMSAGTRCARSMPNAWFTSRGRRGRAGGGRLARIEFHDCGTRRAGLPQWHRSWCRAGRRARCAAAGMACSEAGAIRRLSTIAQASRRTLADRPQARRMG
jgi:hypothetical protein